MEYKFSQLFTWSSGKPIIPTAGNVPIYGSNGIIGYTSTAKYKNRIILGRVGAYCGSVEYCPDDFNATDNTLITTCDETKIAYPFAYYLLKQYRLNDFAGGAAQPLITQGLLKHLKCDIPNLNTQKHIADILSAYDDLIENNNRRIALLEKAAQELYKEWFVRFRFPGHETTKFENGLPEGWDIRKMGDMSKIGSGGDAPKDYSPVRTPEYSVPIFSNGITNDGLYGFAKKGTKKANSITISARGTVGFTCLRFEPYLPIVRLLSIEPDFEVVNVYYLYHNLKNDTIDGYGTSQQQITIPYFSRKRVIVPPVSLQNDFGNIVDKFYIQINQLKAKNENLAQQRDLLLPRLMSGKLEV